MLFTRYACYLIAQNGDSKKEQIRCMYDKKSATIFLMSGRWSE
jgi:hypothetical protein